MNEFTNIRDVEENELEVYARDQYRNRYGLLLSGCIIVCRKEDGPM